MTSAIIEIKKQGVLGAEGECLAAQRAGREDGEDLREGSTEGLSIWLLVVVISAEAKRSSGGQMTRRSEHGR